MRANLRDQQGFHKVPSIAPAREVAAVRLKSVGGGHQWAVDDKRDQTGHQPVLDRGGTASIGYQNVSKYRHRCLHDAKVPRAILGKSA
jgi:hypothetical protein